MLVRPRSAGDLPGCVSVLAQVRAAIGYPAVWPEDPAGWLTPAGASAWVADVGDAVAGHVCLVPGVVNPAVGLGDRPLAAVSRLYVAPARQGQGLAAALLAAVVSHGSQAGWQVRLDVVEDGGRAIGLYEHLGWRLVDRRPADWVMPDGRRLWERIYLAPASPGGTAAAMRRR